MPSISMTWVNVRLNQLELLLYMNKDQEIYSTDQMVDSINKKEKKKSNF